eukprot:TRINITY_DN14739_c0_g1_i1.p1 TRINITY_DN14739_c0_g1~~TRINITY_DN14739_c0_g1_i1.p1  ORF type:complete len:443 (+),score=78.27 TRINITY_DN14739_c0_g1_i1:160-1488(+)
MALRATPVALTGGGGRGDRRRGAGGPKNMTHNSRQSRLARKHYYGKIYSQPHRAGSPFRRSLWRTRTTMAHHQHQAPDFVRLSFKEHLDLRQEQEQLLHQDVPPTHLLPSIAKEEWERWKGANVEALRPHAGRYVVGSWQLPPEEGRGGEGGVVQSFSEEELPALQSYLRDMKATADSSVVTQWLDYIPPGLGEAQPAEIIPQEEEEDLSAEEIVRRKLDSRQRDEDKWWNTTKFDDIDQIREWLDFETKPVRAHVQTGTPVSTRLAEGQILAEPPRPVLPHPNRPKWETFATDLPYGTEQFSPWYVHGWHGHNRMNYKILPTMGFARQFMPAEATSPNMPSSQQHHLKRFVKGLMKRRFALPQWVSPCGREVKLVPFDQLRMQTLRMYRGSSTYKNIQRIASPQSAHGTRDSLVWWRHTECGLARKANVRKGAGGRVVLRR